MRIHQGVMVRTTVTAEWLLSVLLILLLTGTCFSARADTGTALNEKAVAKTGTKTTDFVPRGWKSDEEIKGKLKADSVEDAVLQLVEDKGPKGEGEDRSRALVILSKGADGKYHLAAVAGKLIQCAGCGGVLGGQAGADIKISKGVLLVRQLSGSREATDHLQRFRYDTQSGRFMLVGEDIDEYDRAVGDSVLTSINYLTGKKTIEKRKFDKKLNRYVSKGRQVKAIAKKPIPIEEVDNGE
jgi:hypothetical protein